MKRIVDVSQTGRHLARKHGFMTISENGIEIGRIALDEIQALIVHAHGVTYSNQGKRTPKKNPSQLVLF